MFVFSRMHSLDKHGKMCRYLTHRECGNKTNMYVISSYTLIQASCRGFPDVPQEKIMLILRIKVYKEQDEQTNCCEDFCGGEAVGYRDTHLLGRHTG